MCDSDNVVSLKDYRDSQEPHFGGEVACLECGHTWYHTWPIDNSGPRDFFKCPACSLFKGRPVAVFGPSENDLQPICLRCGISHFAIFVRNGFIRIICEYCGKDATDMMNHYPLIGQKNLS